MTPSSTSAISMDPNSYKEFLAQRRQEIIQKVHDACQRSGRSAEDVDI